MEQQQHEAHETEHEVRNSINKKKRGGRPRLSPEELKGVRICVSYTQSQADKLGDRAAAAGLGDVEFIRRLSLNQAFYATPAINRAAVIELSKIGTNINQLSKVANSSGNAASAAELEGIQAELQRIGVAISGAQ